MKKNILTFIGLIFISSIFAQAPSMFKYQAVARDADGELLKEQTIGLKVSILQGASDGDVVYAETFSPQTDKFGLIAINIGNGTIESGDITSIDWGAGIYYIKTEMDVAGGTSYAEYGIAQLLSVPYALHANEAGNVPDVSLLESQIADQENKISTLENEIIQFNARENELIKAIAKSQAGGYITDFDGNVYPTVSIGSQVWMAKNLRVTKLNDGTPLTVADSAEAWVTAHEAEEPAFTWFLFNEDIAAAKFGANYNFYAVETSKLCPSGWHVPTIDEWFTLEVELGMDPAWATIDSVGIYTGGSTHARAMKTTYGWNNDGNGTNSSGMSILGFGSINDKGQFGGYAEENLAKGANFWSTTENTDDGRIYKVFFNYGHDDNKTGTAPKNQGYHVRCVQD